MAREFELVRYDAGETVIAAGDAADFAALVVDGFARVDVVDSTGARRSIGTFGPGALIGEMALWEGGVRSADRRRAEKIDEKEQTARPLESRDAKKNPLGFLDGDGNGDDETKSAGFASRDSNSRTLAVRFHFDTLASFFERRPKIAARLFRVFARASSSRLREWRLRVAADRARNAAAARTTPRARPRSPAPRSRRFERRTGTRMRPSVVVSSRVSRTITSQRSRASRVWFGVRPDRGAHVRRERPGVVARGGSRGCRSRRGRIRPRTERSSPPKRSSARSAHRSDADGARRRRRGRPRRPLDAADAARLDDLRPGAAAAVMRAAARPR